MFKKVNVQAYEERGFDTGKNSHTGHRTGALEITQSEKQRKIH